MTRRTGLFLLGAMLCTTAAWAQLTSASKVAYIYVSTTPPNSSNYEVRGYAAKPNGELTPIPGSPFQEDVSFLVTNGKYVFGSNRNGTDIDAYSIQRNNGALRYATSSSVTVTQGSDCDSALTLFLDHTGRSLYNLDMYGNTCANATYQSFLVKDATGKLHFMNEAGATPELVTSLTFIGNNQFAYSSSCYHFIPLIYAFRRNANGTLTELNAAQPLPKAAPNQNYCPYLAAADPLNHVAVAVQPMQGYGETAGPYQLATYTANASGVLATHSNWENMPPVLVGSVNDLNMAPSGKLLAVAGAEGLQVFHFNEANPVTKDTGLLTKDPIDQIRWDNANHLYAISRSAGKLFVFTVTPTSATPVHGSPWSLPQPSSLSVLPLTPR